MCSLKFAKQIKNPCKSVKSVAKNICKANKKTGFYVSFVAKICDGSKAIYEALPN
jgi:uncharacterized protein YaaQ